MIDKDKLYTDESGYKFRIAEKKEFVLNILDDFNTKKIKKIKKFESKEELDKYLLEQLIYKDTIKYKWETINIIYLENLGKNKDDKIFF